MFAPMIIQANGASWACHHHRSHPVETDRPRDSGFAVDQIVKESNEYYVPILYRFAGLDN
jgi:hypothetical protein